MPLAVIARSARDVLRDRLPLRLARELRGDATKIAGREIEVDQWVVSQIVLRKLVPAVGIHPFPLNELMLMTSAVAWFQPSHIFEWGTHVGRSARVFYEAASALRLTVEIHSIDLPDEIDHVEHPHGERGRMVRGLERVTLHQGDGIDTAMTIFDKTSPRRALFFVDGDHSFGSVERELTRILTRAPGSAILLHDTFWQSPDSGYNVGPAAAMRQVLTNYPDYVAFSPDLGLPGMTLVSRRNDIAGLPDRSSATEASDPPPRNSD
jgi:cephalosporin hydroxylase